MEKKTKNITIGFTKSDYEKICKNAKKEQRTNTNYCYLIIKKEIK